MKKLLSVALIIMSIITVILTGCGGDTRVAQDGDTVSVHYRGTLEEDGSQFDSSYDPGEPLSFTIGGGQMITGFNDAVIGMKVGEEKTITLPPEEAYGEWDEARVMQFSRSEFAEPLAYSVGDELPLQSSSGYVYYYPIVEITSEYVAVDTNHELAGQTLIFEIELVSIDS